MTHENRQPLPIPFTMAITPSRPSPPPKASPSPTSAMAHLLPEARLVAEGRDVEVRCGDGVPDGQTRVVPQGVRVRRKLRAFLGMGFGWFIWVCEVVKKDVC